MGWVGCGTQTARARQRGAGGETTRVVAGLAPLSLGKAAMPSAAGPDLKKYMDKRLSIMLNGNRNVRGLLRGFDQFMNIVLDESVEVVSTERPRADPPHPARWPAFRHIPRSAPSTTTPTTTTRPASSPPPPPRPALLCRTACARQSLLLPAARATRPLPTHRPPPPRELRCRERSRTRSAWW